MFLGLIRRVMPRDAIAPLYNTCDKSHVHLKGRRIFLGLAESTVQPLFQIQIGLD
jgi:hypothetical protein